MPCLQSTDWMITPSITPGDIQGLLQSSILVGLLEDGTPLELILLVVGHPLGLVKELQAHSPRSIHHCH